MRARFGVLLALAVLALLVYNGTASAAGELGYAQDAANHVIASTTEASPDAAYVSLTVTTPNTPILITGYAAMGTLSGQWALCNLWIDGSDAGRFLFLNAISATGGTSANETVTGVVRKTLTAASHTFALRCWHTGSSGPGVNGASTNQPTMLEVADLATAGGGASTLAGLSDVNTTGAVNDSILKYSTGSSKWVVGGSAACSSATPCPVSLSGDSLTAATDTRQMVGYLVGLLVFAVAFLPVFWRTFGRST